MTCPCQSGQAYKQCCQPYINGEKPAPSPEKLMRSRYCAYTQANTDYIAATMCGIAANGFNPSDAKQWAQSVSWLGLNVIANNVGQDENHGFVEFAARYQDNKGIHFIHELSEFKKIDGHWFYVDGIQQKALGRNSLCLCQSGKKYKRCCGRTIKND